MEQLGKLMVMAALGLLLVGAAVWAAGHFGFRGLPGDVSVEGKGWKVYFPIATSIAVSLLLTLLLNMFFRGR